MKQIPQPFSTPLLQEKLLEAAVFDSLTDSGNNTIGTFLTLYFACHKRLHRNDQEGTQNMP